MYKRILTVLISCAMLSALVLVGCDSSTTDNNAGTSSTTEATATETTPTDDATSQTSAQAEVQSEEETATSTTTEDEIVLLEEEDATYEDTDETVTNPTVAPVDLPDETATASSEVTATTLAGTWKPLMAVSVADSQEVSFSEIYGSAYREYGGSLVIAEDSTFKISMGASIIEDKASGTFTISQNNLLVTYADGSVDTYLYIPQYQNKEVIKMQSNDYYIYFYKES